MSYRYAIYTSIIFLTYIICISHAYTDIFRDNNQSPYYQSYRPQNTPFNPLASANLYSFGPNNHQEKPYAHEEANFMTCPMSIQFTSTDVFNSNSDTIQIQYDGILFDDVINEAYFALYIRLVPLDANIAGEESKNKNNILFKKDLGVMVLLNASEGIVQNSIKSDIYTFDLTRIRDIVDNHETLSTFIQTYVLSVTGVLAWFKSQPLRVLSSDLHCSITYLHHMDNTSTNVLPINYTSLIPWRPQSDDNKGYLSLYFNSATRSNFNIDTTRASSRSWTQISTTFPIGKFSWYRDPKSKRRTCKFSFGTKNRTRVDRQIPYIYPNQLIYHDLNIDGLVNRNPWEVYCHMIKYRRNIPYKYEDLRTGQIPSSKGKTYRSHNQRVISVEPEWFKRNDRDILLVTYEGKDGTIYKTASGHLAHPKPWLVMAILLSIFLGIPFIGLIILFSWMFCPCCQKDTPAITGAEGDVEIIPVTNDNTTTNDHDNTYRTSIRIDDPVPGGHHELVFIDGYKPDAIVALEPQSETNILPDNNNEIITPIDTNNNIYPNQTSPTSTTGLTTGYNLDQYSNPYA